MHIPQIIILGSILAHSYASPLISRADDPCASLGTSGRERFDCAQKPGHYLVKGTCPLGGPKDECKSYCEVKRTGFLGKEQDAPAPAGTPTQPGQPAALSLSSTISITKDLNIGVSAGFSKIFEAAVNFEYSSTTSSGVGVSYAAMPVAEAKYHSKWVYWPMMVTTCGSTSTQKIETQQCFGQGCSYATKCTGTPNYEGNVCSTSYQISSDKKGVKMLYAPRFESEDGKVLDWDLQPPTYKSACPKINGKCNPSCLAPCQNDR